MANSFDSNLIVDAVSNITLANIQKYITPLKEIVTFATSDQPAYGAIQVPVIDSSLYGVNTYAGTFNTDNLNVSAASFSLTPYYVSFAVTDYDNNRSTALRNLENVVASKVQSLANQIETTLWANVCACATAHSTIYTTASGFDSDAANEVRTAMSTLGVRDPGLVLTNAKYGDLLGDLTTNEAYAFADTAKTGGIAMAKGLRVYESCNLPANLAGISLGKTGAALASRYWAPTDGVYEVAQPITDTGTGLTMGLRMYSEPTTGGKVVIITWLGTGGCLDKSAVRRIRST